MQQDGAIETLQSKKFHLRTFGCQMNVADTERMEALVKNAGMVLTSKPDDADVIVINGCSVREKAVHKVVSTLGGFKKIARVSGRQPILGIGGCVGQLEKDLLFKRMPYLDFVFGPDAIDQLPEIIHQVFNGDKRVQFTDFDARKDRYVTDTRLASDKAQAFVNIMKGCDKFCTYCIVPFTRGREKSRTIDEVLDDVAKLVQVHGVREVTLLGQNVNSFGKGSPNTKMREPLALSNQIGRVGPREGDENFPQLLRAMNQDPRLKDLKWIRYTSSHPLDFSDQLMDCYRPVSEGGVARLAPHLHLPVQSGADSMLKRMGRHHKVEDYVLQMEQLKKINPRVGLSTDLIVGFPGETNEEFRATLRLLDRMNYDNIYAFAYSERPGTKASKVEDDISVQLKKDRLNELLDYQQKISRRLYQKYVGQDFEVLVESPAKNQSMVDRGLAVGKVWVGKTACGKTMNFATDSPRDFTGRFVMTRATRATALSLQGELLVDEVLAERSASAGMTIGTTDSTPSSSEVNA